MRKISKGKKVLAAVLSAVLAGSLVVMPAAAYAEESSGSSSAVVINDADLIPDSVASTAGLLTGAASRAAMPSIEILGLASVEESGNFVDLTNFYAWDQPKYWLTASLANSYPSPYLVNYANNYGSASVQAVYNPSREGGGNGPNAALSSTDSTDADVLALADLVIGNGGNATSSAIAYSFSNYSDLVATMYDIAIAADSLASSNSTQLRYGSATTIASLYEQYTMGTIGAVMEALADTNNNVSLRSVVLIEDAWKDSSGNYYFQVAEGKAEDGTASSNRYLETTVYTGIELKDSDGETLALASNYADTLSTSETNPKTSSTVKVASKSDLESASLNLILVGGQQSSSNYSDIMTYLEECGLLSKTYFVENNGSAGSQYGVVMNSVENAQNVGRILGCLYPEVIDQQSWLAYYYENFYHIKSAYLTHVMDSALDGVRCWNATDTTTVEGAVEWDLSDAYSAKVPSSKVASTIAAGLTYLCANTEYVSPAPSN